MRQPIRYSWDPAKRAQNLAKHGLDFEDAWQVFENPDRVDAESRYSGDERRRRMTAMPCVASASEGPTGVNGRSMMSSSKKIVSFTTEELRARSAAGLTLSNWEWVRTHEPDLSDPDAPDFGEEMRAERLRRRGRPKGSGVKSATSIRIDKDVLAAFRATGPGWQTRMNDALRAWIEDTSAPRRKPRAAPKSLARG
jgi:uncharacterized protein (DUF4415 family)